MSFNNKKSEFYSFIDESGHTGLNILDENQPFLVLGNVFSQKNIDQDGVIYFKEIHRKLGKKELHANVEGNKGLAQINTELISLVQDLDLSFHFSVIEKQHYLKIMLFHHFYDNGLNPAVHVFGQAERALRMTLSFNFSQVVEDIHLINYLKALKTKDYSLYSAIHSDLAKKIKDAPFDYRTKELLYDALTYTSLNPKEIFDSMALNTILSPNNTAFILMLNEMNGGFPENAFFKQMIHDEQSELGKTLKQSFGIFSDKYLSSQPGTIMTDFKEVKLLKGTSFELKDSSLSIGLQTVDPAIWLFKRNVLSDKDESPFFWETIRPRMSMSGIGFNLHLQEVQENHRLILSRNITSEQIEKGRELMNMIEFKRWKAPK